MNPKAESTDVFGVNRAGPFAQAQTIAENLRPADAAFVNETAQPGEPEEAALEFRFKPKRFDRSRTVINKRAVDHAVTKRASFRNRDQVVFDLPPDGPQLGVHAEDFRCADRHREDQSHASD